MNPCPEYESKSSITPNWREPARASVDAHVASCAGCTRFLSALTEVDTTLTQAFQTGSELSPAVTERILRQAQRPPVKPTVWPAVFDAIGWTSLIAVLFAFVFLIAPRGLQEPAVVAAFLLVIAGGSAWFVLEGWRELDRP